MRPRFFGGDGMKIYPDKYYLDVKLIKQLYEALDAMHEEFGTNFPPGEKVCVDLARAAKKAYKKANILNVDYEEE